MDAQLEMTWNMHAKLEMNWTRGSNLFAVHKKHVQNKYDFWEEYGRRRRRTRPAIVLERCACNVPGIFR